MGKDPTVPLLPWTFVPFSLPRFFRAQRQQDFPIFQHVSTGDILRQHVLDQSPLGLEAKKFMDAGKLVPDELMIEVVMDDATPYLEDGKALLLDGFPRTLKQAIALEKVTHIGLVVNLDIPTDTIVDRIADRCVNDRS